MQGNVAQQWWYSTILVANTISYTGKFAKMVIQIFLVKMVVGFPSSLESCTLSEYSDLEN